jgi:nitrogen fixation protein FixH
MRRALWIPWSFVGAFVLLIATQAAFVTIAIRSDTGLVSDAAYAEGLHYNDTLDRLAADRQRGWHLAIAFAAEGGGAGIIHAGLTDRLGQPLAARYQGFAERRSGARQTIPLAFAGDAASFAPVAAGRWFVHIEARHGEQTEAQVQEIFVAP